MLRRELLLHAKYLGLKGISKLNKNDLEQAILDYIGLTMQEHRIIVGDEVDIDLDIYEL